MDIKILVAMHKKTWVCPDEVYLPIHVGHAIATCEEFCAAHDDAGENISAKNPYYAELTALYWAWKNLAADVIGLCHYRRYFTHRKAYNEVQLFSAADYEEVLKEADILLPQIDDLGMTMLEYFGRAHGGMNEMEGGDYMRNGKEEGGVYDLLACGEYLEKRCPAALPAFCEVLEGKEGYSANMFAMRKPLFDEYCAWLFPMFFWLESRRNLTDYTGYQTRVFGYLGERMLTVWVRYRALRIAHTEMTLIPVEMLQ